MPLGTLVLPLLTAMNFMRSFHSEENTDPRVLDTDCGGCCYCICFYPFYMPGLGPLPAKLAFPKTA